MASKNNLNNFIAFIFSLILFVGLGIIKYKPFDVIIITVIVFIHESGHLLFMKLFKYDDVKMFFIPFFGAATKGYDLNPDANKQALVALAGPLPGICLGAILALAFKYTENDLYYQTAIMFLSINAFNLLPLYPLDGGRFIESILFSRSPILEIVFKIITSILLGLIAFLLHVWIILILPVLILLTLKSDYIVATTAKTIRNWITKDYSTNFSFTYIPLETIKQKHDLKIILSNMTEQSKIEFINKIWRRINLVAPRLLMSTFLISIFFGSLIIAVFAFLIITHS